MGRYRDDVFAASTSRRGTLVCRVCGARVPPPPTDEVTLLFWPGYRHEMGHPWECSVCDRAFLTPAGLSKHRRAAHP